MDRVRVRVGLTGMYTTPPPCMGRVRVRVGLTGIVAVNIWETRWGTTR